MKGGGADLTVLSSAVPSQLEQHLRSWVENVLHEGDREPDAYAAVAFWFDQATPGRPSYNSTIMTVCDSIPMPVVCQMAQAYLGQESAVHNGENRALARLGVAPDSWEPESGA